MRAHIGRGKGRDAGVQTRTPTTPDCVKGVLHGGNASCETCDSLKGAQVPTGMSPSGMSLHLNNYMEAIPTLE